MKKFLFASVVTGLLASTSIASADLDRVSADGFVGAITVHEGERLQAIGRCFAILDASMFKASADFDANLISEAEYHERAYRSAYIEIADFYQKYRNEWKANGAEHDPNSAYRHSSNITVNAYYGEMVKITSQQLTVTNGTADVSTLSYPDALRDAEYVGAMTTQAGCAQFTKSGRDA